MDNQANTGPGTESQNTEANPRPTFGEWLRNNQNRMYFLLGTASAYIIGTMVGELNARRREDNRWRGL